MYTLIGTLLVLGIAVIVHELGHFIVARRNGVRVEEFCIGFPPRIFKMTRGDTQYSIGIIPVGGFVKMAGEEPGAGSGNSDEFFAQPIPARIRIALAGPFGNFVCAYICALAFLWTGGVQETLHAPVFGTSDSTAIYDSYGLAAGDRIVRVRGEEPASFSDAFGRLRGVDTWPAEFVVQRGADSRAIVLDSAQALEIAMAAYPMIEPVISKVMARSPAAAAGLQAGDRIVSLNDTPVTEWIRLQRLISSSPGETIVLGVDRRGERHALAMVPNVQRQQTMTGDMEKVGRIGIQSAMESAPREFGIIEGLWTALKMVYGFIVLFFDVLWKLLTGGMSTKLLGGPVGIAQYAGESLEQGGHQFLMFLTLINANLGFVNLIPFFLVTDGGLIMLFLIEAIRRRKMTLKSLERWTKLGWAMVLTLLIVATYNDLIIRLELGEKLNRSIDWIQKFF